VESLEVSVESLEIQYRQAVQEDINCSLVYFLCLPFTTTVTASLRGWVISATFIHEYCFSARISTLVGVSPATAEFFRFLIFPPVTYKYTLQNIIFVKIQGNVSFAQGKIHKKITSS